MEVWHTSSSSSSHLKKLSIEIFLRYIKKRRKTKILHKVALRMLFRKKGLIPRSQTRTYTKISRHGDISSIVTSEPISNLSWNLFNRSFITTHYGSCHDFLKFKVWNIFAYYLTSNKQNYISFSRRFFAKATFTLYRSNFRPVETFDQTR